eukprot:1437492-Lingulodinium_polyedra.AAC.1
MAAWIRNGQSMATPRPSAGQPLATHWQLYGQSMAKLLPPISINSPPHGQPMANRWSIDDHTPAAWPVDGQSMAMRGATANPSRFR